MPPSIAYNISLASPESHFTPLSSEQLQLDQTMTQAADALCDGYALSAFALSPILGRFTKLKTFSAAEKLFGPAETILARSSANTLAVIGGFTAEVAGFEGIQRASRVVIGGADPSLLSLENFKEGFLHSAINFGFIKVAGEAGKNLNPILRHGLSDLAMVSGNQFAANLGMIPKPTETFIQQLVSADITNWQMKFGMSIFHILAPGLAIREKAFDTLQKAQSLSLSKPFSFSQYSFAGERFGKNLIFMSTGEGEGNGRKRSVTEPAKMTEQQRATELLARIEECTPQELQELFVLAENNPEAMQGLFVYAWALDITNFANHRTVVRKFHYMRGESLAEKAKEDPKFVDTLLSDATHKNADAQLALKLLGWPENLIQIMRDLSMGNIEAIFSLHEMASDKGYLSGHRDRATLILRNMDVSELRRRAENETDFEAAQVLFIIAQYANGSAQEYVAHEQAALEEIGVELLLEVISVDPDSIFLLLEAANNGKMGALKGLKLMAQRGNQLAVEALKTLQNPE